MWRAKLLCITGGEHTVGLFRGNQGERWYRERNAKEGKRNNQQEGQRSGDILKAGAWQNFQEECCVIHALNLFVCSAAVKSSTYDLQ